MSDKPSDNATPATLNEHSATVEPSKPPKRKRGAPKGNTNAARHGLATGKLPSGCGWIATQTNQLRRALEAAVSTAKGEVSLYDAALVNSACKWERHSALAQRWLRLEAATLTIDQKLAFSREVARASSERDRCLKELKLNATDSRSIIDALYSTPHEPDPSGIEAQASDAQSTEASKTTTPTEGHTDDRDADTDTGPSV